MSELLQDDLFHLDRCLTPAERKKLLRSTRTKKRGHAAPPGTGPAGETCGSCKHIYRTRRYHKCELMQRFWTHGYGTDVLAGDRACKRWEKPEAA